jgi:hypothetical protein
MNESLSVTSNIFIFFQQWSSREEVFPTPRIYHLQLYAVWLFRGKQMLAQFLNEVNALLLKHFSIEKKFSHNCNKAKPDSSSLWRKM